MTPAQPAIVYGESGLDSIWYDNQLDLILDDDTELPYEDGVPLESNWHRHQMNLLIELIEYHWRDRHNFFAGGNMFIYFDQKNSLTRNYRGPDFFVVKNTTHNQSRKSWIAWNEGWQLPNVIVELASPSTITFDLKEKKHLYEQELCTPEYFCYDPETLKLYGWRLKKGVYLPIPIDDQGRMLSIEMGLKLGLWQGEHYRYDTYWLRLYTPDGQLVPKFSEAEAERAMAADLRAESEAKKAKSEAKRAEAEAKKAKAETKRAEAQAKRAEAQAKRAEAEAKRAAEAESRAESESRKAGQLELELQQLKAMMAEKGIMPSG